MFKVWCRVSGGATGTREAWLREGGEEATFETKALAEARASELNRQMNHAHSVASVRYEAREDDCGW